MTIWLLFHYSLGWNVLFVHFYSYDYGLSLSTSLHSYFFLSVICQKKRQNTIKHFLFKFPLCCENPLAIGSDKLAEESYSSLATDSLVFFFFCILLTDYSQLLYVTTKKCRHIGFTIRYIMQSFYLILIVFNWRIAPCNGWIVQLCIYFGLCTVQ